MSQVNVINVVVNESKTQFTEPISFDIFFEALQPLKHSKSTLHLQPNILTHSIDITWKIVYIGQANDPARDQVLEEAEMEELQAGQMRFTFQVNYLQLAKHQILIYLCIGRCT